MTYFLVSPLFPSAGAWCCLPPCPALPRTAPSTCGEDAEGDERLADHVTPVLGTELDPSREEFPGTAQVLRGTGSSSSSGWATGGAGMPGAISPGSFSVWRRKAKWRWRGESAVCPAAPGALLLHPSCRSPGPACAVAKPLPPGPPARTGPPPGLLSPRAQVPGVPAQSGLCWTVGARLQLLVDSAAAQGALHCSGN